MLRLLIVLVLTVSMVAALFAQDAHGAHTHTHTSARVTPLLRSDSGDFNHAFDRLLMSISAGRSDVLRTIDRAVLSAALGRRDRHDPQLIRRRQLDIPRALALLSQETQTAIIAVLEQRYLTAPLTASDAPLFVPAPSALGLLQHAAETFFDHGRMHDFLRTQHLLLQTPASHVQQHAIAQLLIGEHIRPYEPAALIPSRTPVNDMQAGVLVDWFSHAGYLCARDAWGNILWQRPLGEQSQLITGQHYALLKNTNGIHVVHSDGSIRTLPHIPHAQMLGLSQAHAWFAIGTTAYSVRLSDLSYHSHSITLPHAPLGAPLADGDSQLWLTTHDVIYTRAGHIVSRLRHLLPPAPNDTYTLTHNGEHACIQSVNETFVIRRFSDNDLGNAPSTLCRRYDFAGALALCRATSETETAARLLAHFDDFMLADDAWLRAHRDQFGTTLSDIQRLRLAHRCSRSTYTPQQIPQSISPDLLPLIAASDPLIQLPMGRDDVFGYPMQHAISVRGIDHMLSSPTADVSIQTTMHDNGDLHVQCFDHTHTLLWQHLLTGGIHQPSVAQRITSDYIYILAGSNECHILNRHTGSIITRHQLPATMNHLATMHYLGGRSQRIASIGPIGINNHIYVSDIHSSHSSHNSNARNNNSAVQRSFQLPRTPIRWTTIHRHQLLISDGIQCRAYPDARLVPLPLKIITADSIKNTSTSIRAGEINHNWITTK